jgi:hypothetical protein
MGRILKESMDAEKAPFPVGFSVEKLPFHCPDFLLGFGLRRRITSEDRVQSQTLKTPFPQAI